jgi:hypothetical protein
MQCSDQQGRGGFKRRSINSTQQRKDQPMVFTIIVSPRRAREKRAAQNVYDARLIGENELLCSSNSVFLDAARKLLRSGRAKPDDVLIMLHAGSNTEALRANISAAAKLTIEERDAGPHSIRFVRWKPMTAALTTPKAERHTGERHKVTQGMASVSAPVR